jgi:glycosyltransferase involved in cell wall biosynthesis
VNAGPALREAWLVQVAPSDIPQRQPARSVSAVIPAFNSERLLGTAIDSVLEQTYTPIECIVVDDGSTDATAEVARGYGNQVRLVQGENRGAAAARNRGAALAQGEMLAFLDADDRWLPERLERQLEALDARPNVAAVMCATEVVDSDLRPLGVIRQDPELTIEELLLCRSPLVSTGSNLLVTRECYEAVGGFDETLPSKAGAEDWLMIFRLVERGTLTTIPDVLVQYRVHGGNTSASASRLEADMVQVFDRIYSDAAVQPGVQRLRRRAYSNLHRMLAGAYYVERKFRPFGRHVAKSIAWHPSTIPYFLATPVRRGLGRSRTLDPFALTEGGTRRARKQAGGAIEGDREASQVDAKLRIR